MDNYVYRRVFKYVFDNVDIKTKKYMIKYIFEFILPETVDKLMGKSIKITRDVYTGEFAAIDNYDKDKFTKWFFEQPADDWGLIIDSFFDDIPPDTYGSAITYALCNYTSNKDKIDEMVEEIKSLTNKLVDEEIKQMQEDRNEFLRNYNNNQ